VRSRRDPPEMQRSDWQQELIAQDEENLFASLSAVVQRLKKATHFQQALVGRNRAASFAGPILGDQSGLSLGNFQRRSKRSWHFRSTPHHQTSCS
jgi:hypothetical protein